MNSYLIYLAWPEECFRLSAGALRRFKGLVQKRGAVKSVRTERAFLAALPGATHVITWHFKPEWFVAAKKLRVLATPAAGRELVPATGPEGVSIHFGGFHGAIIAENVAAFVLGWARGFFRPELKTEPWPRVALSHGCRRVAGTKAVIAGYGKIGRAIGEKLETLGVEVAGFTRSNIAKLPDAARSADWFVMALPGDTGTDGFLSRRLIAKLPRRSVVVNIGRGNAVDEEALLEALSKRRIAGAYLDVFKGEPGPLGGATGPILSRAPFSRPSNLVVTPHSSAFSGDYLDMCFKELWNEGLL